MKKLLTFAAVAAFAVSSFGASVMWGSGQLKNPVDAGGAWGTKNVGNSAGYVVVWFFDSEANANAFVASNYSDGSLLFYGTVEGTEVLTKDSSASLGRYTGATENVFDANEEYFTVAYAQTVISGVSPEMDNTWYMYSGVGSFIVPGTADASLEFTTGGGFSDGARKWPTNWTPIPEPATGALALAGIALLLRRRTRG